MDIRKSYLKFSVKVFMVKVCIEKGYQKQMKNVICSLINNITIIYMLIYKYYIKFLICHLILENASWFRF